MSKRYPVTGVRSHGRDSCLDGAIIACAVSNPGLAPPAPLRATALFRAMRRWRIASRRVRKHWCSIIDTRRPLRVNLLPLRLDAFYYRSQTLLLPYPSIFVRARIGSGDRLDFLDKFHHLEVWDHCNGLLRVDRMVVNPTTRQ
ncbi:hypothetical protein C2845_PM06G11760 [Panicum miliaceum]|uniref:Uncharacterized protein n=1 Tax=Panicum miliaceum TaxID=4540 RepID=A0A3L6R877_PANMI|nr:hypothetical protein C2845_PM06G11760 [Panicum miliaceum]